MPQKLTPSPQSNQVKLVVSKFGGTSMGDASCMRRSAEVSFERNASVVIVSATSGTTNALIDIGRTAESGRWTESEQKIQSLIEKHQKIFSAVYDFHNYSGKQVQSHKFPINLTS